MSMRRLYRIEYDPGTGQMTEWLKDFEELMRPNGDEPMLYWMMRQAHDNNLAFKLTAVESDGEWSQDVRP